MHHEKGYRIIHHYPQPFQYPFFKPGGFIYPINLTTAGYLANEIVYGFIDKSFCNSRFINIRKKSR